MLTFRIFTIILVTFVKNLVGYSVKDVGEEVGTTNTTRANEVNLTPEELGLS